MSRGVFRLLQYNNHDVLRPASEHTQKCRRGEACVVVMQASQGQGLDPCSDTDQTEVTYCFLGNSCQTCSVKRLVSLNAFSA